MSLACIFGDGTKLHLKARVKAVLLYLKVGQGKAPTAQACIY